MFEVQSERQDRKQSQRARLTEAVSRQSCSSKVGTRSTLVQRTQPQATCCMQPTLRPSFLSNPPISPPRPVTRLASMLGHAPQRDTGRRRRPDMCAPARVLRSWIYETTSQLCLFPGHRQRVRRVGKGSEQALHGPLPDNWVSGRGVHDVKLCFPLHSMPFPPGPGSLDAIIAMAQRVSPLT